MVQLGQTGLGREIKVIASEVQHLKWRAGQYYSAQRRRAERLKVTGTMHAKQTVPRPNPKPTDRLQSACIKPINPTH